MSLLPWTFLLSLLGAGAALAAGRHSAAAARRVALGRCWPHGPWSLAAAFRFTPAPRLQTLVDLAWIPALGVASIWPSTASA